MKLLRIILIGTTTTRLQLLKKKLLNADAIKLLITVSDIKNAEETYKDAADRLDAILFSENITSAAVVQLTKMFRSYDMIIPIFLLTKQSESQVPRRYKKIGIDDVLNIVEIDTPLFSWTFMSAVKHTILKKKAKEFDHLHQRLQSTSESLAHLMHNINNPLSVIRLAMYHLEDPSLSLEKKDTFLKILVGSLDKVDNHMKELRTIRRKLNGEKDTSPQILSINPALNVNSSK